MASKKATEVINWITEETAEVKAFVSIDNQERLYFNASTRKTIGKSVGKGNEYYVGFDAINKTLLVMPLGKSLIKGLKPFRLDARSYAKASVLVEAMGIDTKNLPLRYEYVGTRSTPQGIAYEFKLI